MNTTATPAKWRRRPEERTPEILAAALDCFAKGGFSGTRLDDIAAAAGVTKGTLYLYFPNKEAIFKAVVRQSVLPTIALAEEHVTKATEPASVMLEWLLRRWQETSLPSQCAISKIVVAEAGSFPDLASFYLEEVVARGMHTVSSILRKGIERGEFRDFDVDNTTRCIVWPMLMSNLWQQSLGPYAETALDPVAFRKTLYDVLLRGLMRDPAAS